MKKIINFTLWLLAWVWQFPQNIVGLLFLLFTAKTELYQKYTHERIYVSPNMNGGVSLGNFVILRKTKIQDEIKIEHERGHCKQSRILGWFYLLIIGINSLLHAAFHDCDNYYHFFTEKWADTIMGIKRILNIK